MNDTLCDRLKTLEANFEWRNVLQRNLFGLCKHIEPDNGLIDQLTGSEVLNRKAAESFRVKSTKYSRNQAILEFIQRRPFRDFLKFSDSLCKTEQGHIVDSFFYSGGIETLMQARHGASCPNFQALDESDASPDPSCPKSSFDWRHHIKKHLTCLNEIIDPDHGLIPSLAHKQVIPEWIMDKYLKQDGRCSRVQTILLELISKGDRHFQLFCDSLVETNQSHVVTDYLSPNSVECFRHSLRRSLTCSAVDATGDHLATNWKTLLVKHRTDLTERITPNDDLVTYLEYSGVMNKHCAEHCRDIEPEYKRNEFILNYLQTRPDKDFAAFCTALKHFDQKHVIDEYLQEENVSSAVQESTSAPVTPVSHLEHGGDRNCEPAPQEESFQNENSQTENLQTPQEDAFVHLGGIGDGDRGSGLTTAIQCASERETEQNLEPCFTEERESRSLDSAYSSQLDAEMAVTPDSSEVVEDICLSRPTPIRNVIVLRSSDEFYNINRSSAKSYTMNKRVRGRCIIFNNHRFSRMKERTGTNVDAQLLVKLFKRLLFSVEEVKDSKAADIISRLNAVSQDETLENEQCLAVFILSHGDYRNGKCIIYGVDEEHFTLDDVLNMFTPSNCRQMIGKPKLIFIQACRGEQYDVTDVDGPFENEDQPVISSYPDFLIGFPTQAGYRAFRDIDYGSWYINALTRVFMARAHNTSLNSMMHQVAGIASKWLSQTGARETNNKTQFAIYTCSFTKDLFFFPGIVE